MKRLGLLVEALIRGILLIIFLVMERKDLAPFHRIVHREESYLYGHPKTESYFPAKYLWFMVLLIPIISVLIIHACQRRKEDYIFVDLKNALLCITILLPLNGVVTDIIKLTVGRPRPDFFFRCWPDRGYPEDVNVFTIQKDGTQDLKCTGDLASLIEGRKSFPSGHSSFSFSTFGFVLFYLCGKLNIFSPSQKIKEGPFLLCLCCIIGKSLDIGLNLINIFGIIIIALILNMFYNMSYFFSTDVNRNIPHM